MSSALPVPPYYTEEEFLALEEASPVKHEFLNGIVYDMAGRTQAHSTIAVNIVAALHSQLRGKRCRVQNSDLLTRIEYDGDIRMYYPDVAVYCRQRNQESRVDKDPTVIIEVLSPSTEKYDRDEKSRAYIRIPTLRALLLVGSETRSVTLWERSESGWIETQHSGMDEVIALPSIEATLALTDIYEGLE